MKPLRNLPRKIRNALQQPSGHRRRIDSRTRKLAFEPLEDRRMLALIPPQLSSMPGAPVTLHIDFDGAPAFEWANDIIASGPMPGDSDPIPAFSIDGNVNDFSDAEMDGMAAIWQHVAEKFSPFNVNVTTITPPNYANASAIAIIVGGSDNDFYNKNVGGVAPFEGFTTDASNLGFVFSVDAIDAGSITLNESDRHVIAEAIAHEAGHSFGLWHQSTVDAGSNVIIDQYADGDAFVAPIMGDSGGFPAKRGTWFLGPASNVDIDGSVTYLGIQNDLVSLTRPGNIIAYRPDDFGSFSGSGALNVNSQTGVVTGNGLIETNGDQDAFTFVATGPIVGFTVRNAALGGMLAPTLELIPISGNAPSVILSTTNTSATLTTNNATPGQGYVLRVSPQGNAYGSLGKYTISGNVGNFSTLNAGVLTVYGYEFDNDMSISYFSSTDNIVVQNDIFGGSAIQQFPRNQVNSVVVNTYSGSDTIELFGQLSALSIPVTINAGDGNDTLILAGTSGADTQRLIDATHAQNNATPITFSSIENIMMNGFDGGDTFDVAALPATMSLSINGDLDNDIVNLAPNNPTGAAEINGPLTIEGGWGDDTLNVGSGSADILNTNITFNGGNVGTTGNRIVYHDTSLGYAVTYDIGADFVTRVGLLPLTTLTYYNTQVINLQCGGGADIVNVGSGVTATIQAYGYGGNDEFTIGDGTVGFQPASIYNGGGGTDTIKFDDSQSTANSTTIVQPNLVSFFGGVFSVSTSSFETVNCYAGIGDNTIRIEGGISQNLYVATGAGTDELIATDYTNQFLEGFGFTTYDANFDLGTGLNYLTVDETDGFLTSFDLYPTRLAYADFLALAKTDFNFFNVTGGLTIDASDDANTVRVYGTRPLLSVFEDTISTNGENDQIFLYPHDGAGNTTIKSALRINGGDLQDELFIDDSAAAGDINYTFNNQSGSGVANIVGPGTFRAGSDVEIIVVTTGGGNDTFNINSFQSGSGLSISGGSGDDTVNFGVSNLTAEITNIGPFGFAGQTGADTLNINNTTHPNPFTYSRPSGGFGSLFMSNAFGANYSLNTDLSLESLVLNAGAADDVFRINSVFPNTSLLMNGGAGLDALLLGLPANSLNTVEGKMYFYGQAGGGYVSVSDSADTTGDIVHLDYIPANSFHAEQISLGAHPGDNFFGAGGALYFTDIANFGSIAGVTLDMGSGTDTIYASPLPNARVSINGNNPTSAPGDALKLALAQAQNYVVNNAASPTTLIHEFTGGIAGGLTPYGSVILDGSTLYGTTEFGGDFNSGTVFRVNTDGTGFQLLHEFAAGVADGSRPIASVTLVGSTLYGVTRLGGDFDYGTVFRVNTDGTNYGILHEFLGGAFDGRNPWGQLAYDGTKLYGTTHSGGQFSNGTVFRINPNGGGFGILKSFGSTNDGSGPRNGVTLDGTVLYGTTAFGGGTGSVGTVYRLDTDGGNYQRLHAFLGGAADGRGTESGVAVVGSTIYGTTLQGGDFNLGTVYRLNTDGMGFQLLHEFAGSSDGRQPYASPTVVGSTIYGTTVLGGSQGTVYRLSTDGSGYQILHTFTGGAADGGQPRSSLTLAGSKLYGTTLQGGDFNSGTVFSIPVSGSGNVTSSNLATLDWTGIEQAISVDAVRPQIVSQNYLATPQPKIRVQFSEDVPQPLSASYLYLSNETTTQLIPASVVAVAYDAGTDIADFTFPGLFAGRLPAGNYKAAILGTLTDLFGNPIGNETFFMFTVTPPVPGDVDGSGTVDQADYAVIRTNFGSVVPPGTMGDANGNGFVDGADYVVWRKNLGAMSPGGGAALAAAASATTAPDVAVYAPTVEPSPAVIKAQASTVAASNESLPAAQIAANGSPFGRTAVDIVMARNSAARPASRTSLSTAAFERAHEQRYLLMARAKQEGRRNYSADDSLWIDRQRSTASEDEAFATFADDIDIRCDRSSMRSIKRKSIGQTSVLAS